MDEIELIIFDCDGVLVDSEPISAGVLLNELANLGFPLDEQEIGDRFLGISLREVAENFGMARDTDEFDQFSKRFHEKLLAEFTKHLKAMPKIKDVLSRLSVASCVASSSSRERVSRSLALCGLAEFFGENIFTSSQVEKGKPSPDLFLLAANSLGVHPRACLVIEDSLPGIRAAKAANMRVVRFLGGSHLKKTQPPFPACVSDVETLDTWEVFFDRFPSLRDRRQ